MDVQYSPDVKQQSARLKLLEHASDLLQEILGPESAAQMKAEWKQVQDRQGRPLYRLGIRDLTVTEPVSTDFAPDELENSLHTRYRLYRLWGDLLRVRNDEQHRQVQILSGQLATG